MESNLLLLLLIGHFIGDYYLQNDQMAQNKKDSLLHQLGHGVIFLVLYLILLYPLGGQDLLVIVAVVTLLHMLLDLSKYGVGKLMAGKRHGKIIRHLRKWDESGVIYLVDQGLHVLILIIVAGSYGMSNGSLNQWVLPFVTWQIDTMVLRYGLAVLIILKPVNITFRELFSRNKPSGEVTFMKDLSVGKKIGHMERLMVLIFLILNQYTAIGLVFTAKSVTRYNRIAEEPAFAEYYLLGTLFSILATLLVYLVVIYF